MAREIVLDTETTGFEPTAGHRLVEIACLEIEDFIPTGRSFHVYIDPCRDMPIEAERVLARPGMTPERLDAILAQQMADAEKRARAHFVVDTSRGLEPARAQVAEIIAIMRDPARRPARDHPTLSPEPKAEGRG